MSKKTSLTVLLLFLLSANFVYGQNKTITLQGGGISKATGDGCEYWNIGFNISGELFQEVTKNLSIGCRVAYNRWSPNEDELTNEFSGISGFRLDVSGSASIIELLPSVRLISSTSPNQKTQFFGQIGAGYYILNMETEISASYNGSSATGSIYLSENKFGINFGAGIIIASSINTNLSICPMYNIIFTEQESIKYFTVNLGIIFECYTQLKL